MKVWPTLHNKKVNIFLDVEDLCLFMDAAMTVLVRKTQKCLADMDSQTRNLINNTSMHTELRCYPRSDVNSMSEVYFYSAIGDNRLT